MNNTLLFHPKAPRLEIFKQTLAGCTPNQIAHYLGLKTEVVTGIIRSLGPASKDAIKSKSLSQKGSYKDSVYSRLLEGTPQAEVAREFGTTRWKINKIVRSAPKDLQAQIKEAQGDRMHISLAETPAEKQAELDSLLNERADESWQELTDFEPQYLISDHGRLLSLRFRHILSNPVAKNGYVVWKLMDGLGNNHTRYAHRLVGQTFLENPEDKPIYHHIDHIKTNNHVENLLPATYVENRAYYDEYRLAA